MTEDARGWLIARHPLLYHMAEPGSWESIRRHGLLSTTALLDLYGISGAERLAVEAARRPRGVVLRHPQLGEAVIRDQTPMDDASLTRCLRDGLQPTDWYRLLNGKVFFWPSWDRLVRLINARAYREREHEVLVIDTASLVTAHVEGLWLSAINSGCSRPFPQPRGHATFRRIADGLRFGQTVAEVVVDHAVPKIERHVIRVLRLTAATAKRDMPLCERFDGVDAKMPAGAEKR